MNVAVLGGGNGGCATAFDFAVHGHEVRLFDFNAFPDNTRAIAAAGGIEASGDLKGFGQVTYAGHDIQRALEGVDLVIPVGPAYSTRPFGEACRPHICEGQVVIVCPSSCGGSIEFKNGAGLDLRDESVVVAETSTLPYAVRVTEPGRINVFLKLQGGFFLAALPGHNTQKVLALVRDVYPGLRAGRNILQTTLQNANPVIHPAITLANAARIERTGGDFCFYEDGVSPAVGRLIEAVDRERIALGAKLGVTILSDPELGREQGYMTEATYCRGYVEAPGFKGIKAQPSLDHRYFNEDVGYGLVFMHSLGQQIGVDTPTMAAVIKLASILMDRDYLAEAPRTMESLGLAQCSAEELARLLA